jgi:DinB family protein
MGRLKEKSGRPAAGEFAEYAADDIAYVEGDDIVDSLLRQAKEVLDVLGDITEDRARGITYAPGKWTLKEVVGHMIDDERIFAYRILCVARNEPLPLPGFDEKHYVAFSDFEQRTLANLLSEYRTVRAATVSLFESFNGDMWKRRGIVNGYEASARGLAFHVAGHELRHLRILRERYLGQRTSV